MQFHLCAVPYVHDVHSISRQHPIRVISNATQPCFSSRSQFGTHCESIVNHLYHFGFQSGVSNFALICGLNPALSLVVLPRIMQTLFWYLHISIGVPATHNLSHRALFSMSSRTPTTYTQSFSPVLLTSFT